MDSRLLKKLPLEVRELNISKFITVVTSLLPNRVFYNMTDVLNGYWTQSEFDI